MLPQSDDLPTAPSQSPKVAQVSLSISANLRPPERLEPLFPFWQTIAVPEVAVYKDRDFLPRQNDVGTAWKTLEMLSETNPSAMKFRSNEPFQVRVFGSDARH